MSRHVHLDMLRGVAALAVVMGHIRGFVFVSYGELTAPGPGVEALYAASSLGHQAVVAFFALSGYLVGGQALRGILLGAWSFPDYMIARLARLWTVAIPALLLTLIVDWTGRALGGGAGYDGAWYALAASGPNQQSPADLSASTFLGNLAFLQMIAVPVYGSNGPLWSLANEFWYYVLGPLVAITVLMRRCWPQSARVGVAALIIAVLLPGPLVLLGLIWAAGALVNHVAAVRSHSFMGHPLYLAATILLVVAAVIFSRGAGSVTADLTLGVAWAALIPALALRRPSGALYTRVATGLAEISYTLYATHFPLLAFAWFVFMAPRKAVPGLSSMLTAGGLLVVLLLAAVVLWWCFERNTARVREVAHHWLCGRAVSLARNCPPSSAPGRTCEECSRALRR